MGTAIVLSAAVGGAGAGFVSDNILLFVFATLAFTASFLMLVPVTKDSENPGVAAVAFSRFRAVTAASGVGLLGGLVGQGGSFILIPLMTSYVQIPTRIAIGSNLAIVLLSSLAGFIGKATTGQVEWLLTIPIVLYPCCISRRKGEPQSTCSQPEEAACRAHCTCRSSHVVFPALLKLFKTGYNYCIGKFRNTNRARIVENS